MLFAVHPAAMDGPESVHALLDAILARVEDDIHLLEVIEADVLEASRWYQSIYSVRKRLLQEAAKASLNRAPRTQGPHVRKIDVRDGESAARARALAYTPLLVLVENDVSDGALVEAAVRMLGAPTTVELCFGAPSQHAPPAFQIESRGGHGTLKELVTRRLQEAAVRGRPPRLVVVTDSDGEWPGEVKDWAQAIRDICAAHRIPCPPLNKRTAENYIPDSVWRAWAAVPDHTTARPAVAALLKLSQEQRDHVHISTPGKPPWNATEPRADALFQSPPVSPADRALLEDANLKGKRTNMMILALHERLAALSPADLRARDQHGDLSALVRCIEDEL